MSRRTRLSLSLFLLAVLAQPYPATAVGEDDTAPPQPTPTARCPDGSVWDASRRACVEARSGTLSDDALHLAVRELAYLGRYESAALVLAAMSNPMDDRVLAYRGYLARMQGDTQAAKEWYLSALSVNPDNLLVRSYMGQGLVSEGRLAEARIELAEIRTRGGGGSWAELALAEAIASGTASRY